MTEITPIVFARGQNESIDPRVLPVDQHKAVNNVRFRKDGRPQKRPAVLTQSMTGFAAPYKAQYVNFVAEFQGLPLLSIGGGVRSYDSSQSEWRGTGNLDISHFAPGERIPITRADSLLYQPLGYPSVATSGSINLYVWSAVYGASKTLYFVAQTTGGAQLTTNPSFATSGISDYPRVLYVNSIFYLFYLSAKVGTTGSLLVRTWNPTTLLFSSATTLQTVTGGGAFDVAPHGSSEFMLVWQQSLTSLQAARYSAITVPTIIGSAVTIATNSSAQFPSISSISNTSSIFIAWAEQSATPAARFAVYDSTLATQTASPTNLYTPVAGNLDQVGINVTASTTATMFVGQQVQQTTNGLTWGVSQVACVTVSSTGTIVSTGNFGSQRLASKPFNGPKQPIYGSSDQNFCFVHTPELDAWEDQRATYLNRFNPNGSIARQLWVPNLPGAEVITSGVPQSNIHLSEVVDTGAGLLTALTVQLRGYSSLNTTVANQQNFGIDSVLIHSIFESQFWAARDTAMAGRVLQISGGSLMEWNGTTEETSFSGAAVIPFFQQVGIAGSLTLTSTYIYRAVYEYLDNQGRRVRSDTSDPVSVTLTGTNQSVELGIDIISSIYRASLQGASSIHLYRTLAGQSTYHRVTTVGMWNDAQSYQTYVDGLSDTAAAANEFIYTDGGVLDHNMAPPSQFMCVCNGRLWLGGQFDRTVLTASKTLIDGEPTQFSIASEFNVYLPKKCTGLASIDGTVVAFAADAIYLITGTGPNNQGIGSFDPPGEHPCDDGCVDWRSVVETSQGVFYLGRRGIYLLQRGFNASVFIGGPVEDTLKTYPFVTSATLVAPSNGDETSVRFTVSDGTGTNPGAVLIYSLRTGGWIVDTTQTGELVGPGGEWLGQYVQTTTTSAGIFANCYVEPVTASYAEGNSAAFIPSVLTTGDVRPFGIAGYGNFVGVTVLGEYRGNANVVVTVSVDGVTSDTFTFPVTSADGADGVVYLDVTPRVRKGSSIAVSITDAAISGAATEGFITQAVFIETDAMAGSKRLAVARRA